MTHLMAVSVYLSSTTYMKMKTSRHVKGVPFINKKYIKVVHFCKNGIYKRGKGWTLGRGLPVLSFVK